MVYNGAIHSLGYLVFKAALGTRQEKAWLEYSRSWPTLFTEHTPSIGLFLIANFTSVSRSM
jgi:hypothetical protein